MTRPLVFTRWHARAAMTAILFSAAAAVSAQGGGQATPPMLVPLSGRAASGGSVVVAQTPVPGATTSVNTINPTVQVQGAFAGSTRTGTRAPLAGALSLQDAIRRGL